MRRQVQLSLVLAADERRVTLRELHRHTLAVGKNAEYKTSVTSFS